MSDLVEVLRTGQLYQADMADLALREKGIPHFLRQETSAGLRLAMPVLPTMFPGTWWTIQVPEECVAEATDAIAELPFTTSRFPDVWDCQANEKSRERLSRISRNVVLLTFLFLLLLFVGAVLHDIFRR